VLVGDGDAFPLVARARQVAEKLGLPASYLSKIEKGTRRLDVIELIQIASAMGADAGELVGDVEKALR